MRFIANFACTSKQHCPTCRDLKGGRQWREDLRKGFTLPDDKTDFECPFGVPWNPTAKQLPKPQVTKSQVPKSPKLKFQIPEGAIETCNNCGDARACPNTHVCCGGELVVRIQVPCPRGKWKAERQQSAVSDQPANF